MEDFVTFEIAKKLKLKGFPQHMRDDGYITEEDDAYNIGDREGILFMPDYLPYIAAPTIAQVLKWLRKEKRIDAGAIWSNDDKVWVGYVNEMDIPDLVSDYVLPHNSYDSYECAVMSAIEYILDNNLI